jgi:hypothetical protein
MYRIHGFEPREVVPTTSLVMSHVHPDDRAAAEESRKGAVERGEPFSFVHRISTAAGSDRVVVAAGHVEHLDERVVVVGHLIDITDVRQEAVARELDGAVEDFVWCSSTASTPTPRGRCCVPSVPTPTARSATSPACWSTRRGTT